MAYEYYGAPGPHALPDDEEYDPVRGITLVKSWIGDPSVMENFYASYKAQGVRCSKSNESGGMVVKVYYGTGDTSSSSSAEPDTESWSLVGNDLEKSLWDHPVIRAQFDLVTNVQGMARLRGDIKALIDGVRKVTNDAGEEIDLTLTLITTNAAALGVSAVVLTDFIHSLAKGTQSFPVSQYVLRRVHSVNNSSAYVASIANVGLLFKATTLLNTYPIPNTVKFSIANGYWLQRTPEAVQVRGSKWEITQEWWHADSYDPFLYTPV